MSQEPAVLFANEAFYIAFASRDVDGMDDLWARQNRVTCIHPGWPPLDGRDAVMESWANILSNTDSPAITCTHSRAFIIGTAAYVICHENLEQATLVATNIFALEDGGWKMVHHQAAPAPAPEETEPPEKPTVQ